MADFDAIDALLAAAGQETPLPPAAERRALREGLNLSRAQLAQALGVGPSTVGGWEAGRDPSGEVREKYAYFLVVLAVAQPCVLCGQPARHQVEGFPQHLDPAECAPAAPAPVPAQAEKPAPRAAPRQPAPARKPRPAASGVKVVPVGRRLQTADAPDRIGAAVAAALTEHAGDVDAATAALVKRAIPDAMALLDDTRKGGRYDVVAHPWLPDILRKQSARGADQVWEARPKWSRPELPTGVHEITALDVNGAYLSALKTHLPLGQLEHSTGNHHDRRRAGLHLITPPAWEHEAVLPNPIGNRDEPGPLWVTEPTLRLLLRVSGPKYGLCDPPEIHESWTSGATEGLLEKFRIALKDARDRAIADGDEVTLEYVKAMYSKFVSTLGESNYNRELYRTDWMHLIRSQAFANLWWKAHRAYDEGLLVVRAMGTDELHVAGDWRVVFPEGRGVTEVKVKDTYTVGIDPSTANEPPESAS
ncbi:helix-turn-helix transcriptional regulator [Streptomyces sp. NBC_00414]|uniref:helix-turn-helix domain-containing protein n=1 Tax=Streptomyces sp. NBC_00414 TaxID=2975739 RepID=UPI002E1EB132